MNFILRIVFQIQTLHLPKTKSRNKETKLKIIILLVMANFTLTQAKRELYLSPLLTKQREPTSFSPVFHFRGQ